MNWLMLILVAVTLTFLFPAAATSAHAQTASPVTIEAKTATSFEDGLSDGVFLVSRSGSTTQPLTVHLHISGSATNGVDYLTLGNEVQIPAGASSVEVRVKPVNDTTIEPDELVTIEIGDVAINSTFNKTLATVTIKDNDTVVKVETVDANGSESDSHPIVFRISRNGNIRSQLTVEYAINSSTTLTASNSSSTTTLGDGSVKIVNPPDATPGSDFATLPGSLTFQPGETSKQISVVPIDDSGAEPRETVTINLLKSPLYTLGIRTASGFIDDNDNALPVVKVTTIAPGSEAGVKPVVFRFERSGDVTNPLTVNYAINRSSTLTNISDGSSNTITVGEATTVATSGVDFIAPSGVITFAAGQSTVTVSITPIDDTVAETIETISVMILSNQAYTIGGSRTATGFIDDNDGPSGP